MWSLMLLTSRNRRIAELDKSNFVNSFPSPYILDNIQDIDIYNYDVGHYPDGHFPKWSATKIFGKTYNYDEIIYI